MQFTFGDATLKGFTIFVAFERLGDLLLGDIAVFFVYVRTSMRSKVIINNHHPAGMPREKTYSWYVERASR